MCVCEGGTRLRGGGRKGRGGGQVRGSRLSLAPPFPPSLRGRAAAGNEPLPGGRPAAAAGGEPFPRSPPTPKLLAVPGFLLLPGVASPSPVPPLRASRCLKLLFCTWVFAFKDSRRRAWVLGCFLPGGRGGGSMEQEETYFFVSQKMFLEEGFVVSGSWGGGGGGAVNEKFIDPFCQFLFRLPLSSKD